MFKDSRALDAQRTAASFKKSMQAYTASSEKWFDGTAVSLDRRMDKCASLIHSARFAASRLPVTESSPYLRAERQLTSDLRALEALREDMLTGASHREDVHGPSGRRTAKLAAGISLASADQRWVDLESSRFVAANTDCLGDLDELGTRAANHAAFKTSTFTPQRSASITRVFVSKVVALGKQAYTPGPVRTASVVGDFAPEAMFL